MDRDGDLLEVRIVAIAPPELAGLVGPCCRPVDAEPLSVRLECTDRHMGTRVRILAASFVIAKSQRRVNSERSMPR